MPKTTAPPRDAVLRVRVTLEQAEAFALRASAEGLSVSELLRQFVARKILVDKGHK